MKEYQSISRDYVKDGQFYCFDKLDGSLFRSEFSTKRGFYKFGSKTQLIDKNTHILGQAIDIFLGKYEKDLIAIFEKQRWDRVVCFGEFFGQNSFAGNHTDEKHDVVLFDVSVRDELIEPKEFIDIFGNLHIPQLLHRGNVGEEFINMVHDQKLDGLTFEGVVCKGKWNKKQNMPYMFKIKSNAWIKKLREYCNGNSDLFARLL
jgi:hypothetical protein